MEEKKPEKNNITAIEFMNFVKEIVKEANEKCLIEGKKLNIEKTKFDTVKKCISQNVTIDCDDEFYITCYGESYDFSIWISYVEEHNVYICDKNLYLEVVSNNSYYKKIFDSNTGEPIDNDFENIFTWEGKDYFYFLLTI